MFSISLSRFSNNRKNECVHFLDQRTWRSVSILKITKSEQCLITMTDLFLSYENTPFAGENISEKDKR